MLSVAWLESIAVRVDISTMWKNSEDCKTFKPAGAYLLMFSPFLLRLLSFLDVFILGV